MSEGGINRETTAKPVSVGGRARLATTVLGHLSGNEIRRQYRRLLGGSRQSAADASHARAVELRRALEDLGPFFIKVGRCSPPGRTSFRRP